MENEKNTVESLWEAIEAYVKTNFELYKLKLLDTTAGIVSSLVSRILILFIFSLFVLVLNLGIAFWLGEVLGKIYYGFFAVAGFYLVAGILLILFRKQWITGPLSNMIIKQSLKS